MAKQKLEPSARTVRRWCLSVAAFESVQTVTVLAWVVAPGQRLVSATWALLAGIFTLAVYLVIPDGTERTPREPHDRKRELTGEDWRVFFASITPVFFGMLMKDTLPGRPGSWVENGVWLSATLSAAAALTLISRFRRRHRHPGTS